MSRLKFFFEINFLITLILILILIWFTSDSFFYVFSIDLGYCFVIFCFIFVIFYFIFLIIYILFFNPINLSYEEILFIILNSFFFSLNFISIYFICWLLSDFFSQDCFFFYDIVIVYKKEFYLENIMHLNFKGGFLPEELICRYYELRKSSDIKIKDFEIEMFVVKLNDWLKTGGFFIGSFLIISLTSFYYFYSRLAPIIRDLNEIAEEDE